MKSIFSIIKKIEFSKINDKYIDIDEAFVKTINKLFTKFNLYNISKNLDKAYINKSFKINKEINFAKRNYYKFPKTQNKSVIFKEGKRPLLSDKINTHFSLSVSSLKKGESLVNFSTFKTEIIQDKTYPTEYKYGILNYMKSKKISLMKMKLKQDRNLELRK